jgi:hypothetical protein
LGQNLNDLKQVALKDAKTTAQATLNQDFETVLKYTHPKILELSGGIEKLLPKIKSMFLKMKNDGFAFTKADADFVSDVVKEQGEFRCYVRNNNVMKYNEMTIKSTSYLLGFYLEKEKHWVFVEASKMKSKQHKELFFPDFETSLNIPDDVVARE